MQVAISVVAACMWMIRILEGYYSDDLPPTISLIAKPYLGKFTITLRLDATKGRFMTSKATNPDIDLGDLAV